MEGIAINTFIPRSGSLEIVYKQDSQVLYAIFGGLEINWAKFMLNSIKSSRINKKTKIIYFAPYIMKILAYEGIG